MNQHEQLFIRAYERWIYYSETGNSAKAEMEIQNARKWWAKMNKQQRDAHSDKASEFRKKK